MSETDPIDELRAGMAQTLAAVNAVHDLLEKRWREKPSAPGVMLNLKDVAEQLAVSDTFARRLIVAGKLRGLQLPGGLWRVKRADLDAFLGECAPKSEQGIRLPFGSPMAGEKSIPERYDGKARPCISMQAAARVLGVSVDGVSRLASAKKLEVVRFGPDLKIPVLSLVAYFRDRLTVVAVFESGEALTIQEAAELLHEKPQDVRDLIEHGGLRAIQKDATEFTGTILRDSEIRIERRAVMERLARLRRKDTAKAALGVPAEVLPFPSGAADAAEAALPDAG